MKHVIKLLTLLLIVVFIFSCTDQVKGVKYTSVRSSTYGIIPFPGPSGWKNAINSISGKFSGSQSFIVWILAELGPTYEICHAHFPSDGKKEYENIIFDNVDTNEIYLDYFDDQGIKVFLQVEPGSADVGELIDLVLTRYQHHESVIGFGVDNEWYKQAEAEKQGLNPGFGMKVFDEDAEAWEKHVKSYNKDYRLFLKHWDVDWMPQKYRGDIIFINDTQEIASLKGMMYEYKNWADAFYPNDVIFQTGYLSDKRWWGKLHDPVKDIAKAVKKYGVKQDYGICWVDFTLGDVANIDDDPDAEVVFADEGNIAIGKNVVASAIEADGFNADKAVDGNPSTRWSSKDVDPSWIYIDLEKKTDIDKVVLVWETSYSSKYRLEVSDDAESWEEVYYNDTTIGDIEEIAFDNVNARYIRLFGIERAFDEPEYGHSLWEFKVYAR